MARICNVEEKYEQVLVAVHAAATATEARTLFVAPRACVVTGVSLTPDVASTGDATNTTNLNLINKGSAGAGTTEVGNLDLASGTDLVAYDEKVIPLNATYLTSGVAMAAGDVLALQFEKVASGVLVGPGQAKVVWYPTA